MHKGVVMTEETKAAQPAQKPQKKEIVTMRQLLECGVHFGHQTKRWNARMARYIFTARNDIHVIDLQQTMKLIKTAYRFLKELTAQNGKILLVGTKKQAQEAIETEARRCNMFWVNKRWLGGTLTNHTTIKKSVQNMNELAKLRDNNELELLSKKEASRKTKLLARLEHYLTGIKDMKTLPDAIFIVDTQKEQLAVKEANKLGIPIIGVVDTNSDPLPIDYPIPANDDAIRAIRLLCSIISDGAIDGQNEALKNQLAQPKAEQTEEPAAAVKQEAATTIPKKAVKPAVKTTAPAKT